MRILARIGGRQQSGTQLLPIHPYSFPSWSLGPRNRICGVRLRRIRLHRAGARACTTSYSSAIPWLASLPPEAYHSPIDCGQIQAASGSGHSVEDGDRVQCELGELLPAVGRYSPKNAASVTSIGFFLLCDALLYLWVIQLLDRLLLIDQIRRAGSEERAVGQDHCACKERKVLGPVMMDASGSPTRPRLPRPRVALDG